MKKSNCLSVLTELYIVYIDSLQSCNVLHETYNIHHISELLCILHVFHISYIQGDFLISMCFFFLEIKSITFVLLVQCSTKRVT